LRRRILGIFSVECFAVGRITNVVDVTRIEGLISSFGFGIGISELRVVG
jgi:hypothetical protein